MKKHIFSTYILATVVALASSGTMVSCGGQDDPGTSEVTSDRAYLEDVATTFLGYIKPNDQANLIRSFKAFVTYCENYRFPDNFYDNDVQRLKESGAAVLDALENDDYVVLSRATAEFVYSMARFNGMYQANSNIGEWQYIEPREHVNFRYWIGTSEYNMTIQGVGGSWNVTVPTDHADYVFNVPKNLQLALYPGNIPNDFYINYTVITDGKDGDHFNSETSGKWANVEITTNTKATNTKIKEDANVYIHNVSTYYRYPMVYTTTEINGNGLCSVSAWQKVAVSNDPKATLGAMLTSGNSTVNIIDRVNIKTQVDDMKGLIANLDEVWTGADAKTKAEDVATALKRTVGGKAYYLAVNNATKVRATLGWEAYQTNDIPGGQAWSVRPTITFASDGATYDFASFFGNGRFLSIERQYTALINQYKNLWK